MAKFSWRDLPRVAWGSTFKLAVARGVASGLVITPFILSNSQAGLAEASAFFVFWSLFSGIGGMAYQFFLRGLMIVFAWLPPFLLGAAIMQFILSLAVACGDPLVFIVHKVSPRFLELREFNFFNFETFIFVVKDEDEEAYSDEVEYSGSQAGAREPLRSHASDEVRGVAGERDAAQQPAPVNWIETTSSIANDRIRHALEAANSYLDDATVLVHPPTELDPTKADEIDRLVVRAREHLAEARAENETANEPGVSDYIELLDAGAEQYAGMAHALGRRRLAEGARVIERAIERLERIGRRQGQNTTHPIGLYLLSIIYLELGDRGAALSFIRRAVAANPDDDDYRRLQRQIESEIGGSVDAEPRRSGGGALAFTAIALIAIVGGGVFYIWQSGNRTVQADATANDPNHFEVAPYAAQEVIVAREDGLNFRALPFARPDIVVLRETVAGEILNVTGLVNQPDGVWYQVRLADGTVGYFKASLAVPQSEHLASIIESFVGQWQNADAATRDITRFSIRQADGSTYVRAFGSCMPTDCDWGEVQLTNGPAEVSGRRTATAFFDQGFSEVRLTLTIETAANDTLSFRAFTSFKDGSGRQDYQSQGYMRRGWAPESVASAPVERSASAPSAGALITRPRWIERPAANDFARYYPPAALNAGVDARVVLDCIVGSDGRVNCVVTSENPTGWGFGEASLRLSGSFRMAPQLEDGTATDGGRVRVPISWRVR